MAHFITSNRQRLFHIVHATSRMLTSIFVLLFCSSAAHAVKLLFAFMPASAQLTSVGLRLFKIYHRSILLSLSLSLSVFLCSVLLCCTFARKCCDWLQDVFICGDYR